MREARGLPFLIDYGPYFLVPELRQLQLSKVSGRGWLPINGDRKIMMTKEMKEDKALTGYNDQRRTKNGWKTRDTYVCNISIYAGNWHKEVPRGQKKKKKKTPLINQFQFGTDNFFCPIYDCLQLSLVRFCSVFVVAFYRILVGLDWSGGRGK